MGSNSKIEWTDHTFNPWWGCTKVSPACDHCYAESFAARVGYSETGSQFPIWGKDTKRRFFGDKHWAQPYKWNDAAEKDAKPQFVFCASMADVMEDHPDLRQARLRLHETIEETKWLIWILLTKRPQNFRKMLPKHWLENPRPNVIGATTVESQEYIWRADELSNTPFAYRAVSVEPMLGPLDLTKHLRCRWDNNGDGDCLKHSEGCPTIDWVFAGGESGHGARPMKPLWAQDLRDQCQDAGVPFLFKQWGEYCYWSQTTDEVAARYSAKSDGPIKLGKKAAGRLLDGREWNEFPEVKNGDR